MMHSRSVMFIGMFVAIASSMTSPNAEACGLVGCILEAAGRATGIKPLADLGRNGDAEHKRFKENNPVYKNFEETASEMARTPFSLACTATFETIVGSVRAMCSGVSSQSIGAIEHAVIEKAKRRLLDLGVTSDAELSGVTIRWCQGNFSGYGITPGPSEIFLNQVLFNRPLDDIALTLAHELHHIRQFRSMRAGPFKCNYAQQFMQCGGCQDQRHPMEREAYQFEAAVAEKMASTEQISPNTRVVAFSSLRGTGTFLDQRPRTWIEPEPPTTAKKVKMAVPRLATLACTLEGRVSIDKVASCMDDLEVLFDDLGKWMIEDREKDDLESDKYYLELAGKDIDAACQILAHTVKSESHQKTRVNICKLVSRNNIRELRGIVVE